MLDNELKISNRFMIAEFILCAAVVFYNLSARPGVVSRLFTLSFIILAVFFFYIAKKNKESYELYGIVFYILWVSFLCVLLNSFGRNQLFGFSELKNYLIFCATIIFMFLMLNIKTDKKVADVILVFNIFISALYPIANKYFPQTSNMHLSVGITLNFSNPNLAGMWILQSLFYLALAFLFFKSKALRALIAVLFAMNFSLLNQTGARNCMIAFFAFVVFCAWAIIKNKTKISNWLIGVINVVPITFLFVYLRFIDFVVEKGWFDFLVSEGKNLTSRVEIWERNLNKIKDCWLIGSYYTAAGNTHNAHLVVLGSFGAITLLLVIYFMYKLCTIVNEKTTSTKSLYCMIAFYAVIFMGIGEGAFFSGAMGIYIMACGYIYLARAYYENDVLKDGAKR